MLNLSESFLNPPFYEVEKQKISKKKGSVVGQLNENSLSFLKTLFERYSEEKEPEEQENQPKEEENKVISFTLLQSIFEKFSEEKEEKIPFDVEFLKSCSFYDSQKKDHFLSLSSFIGLWHHFTLQDYSSSIKNLSYLGFPHSPSLLALSFYHKSFKKERKLFNCYLLGKKFLFSFFNFFFLFFKFYFFFNFYFFFYLFFFFFFSFFFFFFCF